MHSLSVYLSFFPPPLWWLVLFRSPFYAIDLGSTAFRKGFSTSSCSPAYLESHWHLLQGDFSSRASSVITRCMMYLAHHSWRWGWHLYRRGYWKCFTVPYNPNLHYQLQNIMNKIWGWGLYRLIIPVIRHLTIHFSSLSFICTWLCYLLFYGFGTVIILNICPLFILHQIYKWYIQLLF